MVLILLMLQVLLVAVVVALFRSRAISPVLAVCLGCYVALWHLTPVLLTLGLWPVTAAQAGLGYDRFVSYACLESLMLLTTLVCLLVPRPWFAVIAKRPTAKFAVPPGAALAVVLLTLACLAAVSLLGGQYWGETYAERNAAAVQTEGTSTFGASTGIGFVTHVLLCFTYAALLFPWPKGATTKALYAAVAACVAVEVWQEVRTGGRIAVLLLPILLALYGCSRRWSLGRMVFLGGGMVGGTLVLGGVLALVIGEQRSRGEVNLAEAGTTLGHLLAHQENSSRMADQFATELATKFDSISSGAYLVEDYGAGVAPWNPYAGAFLALVPRVLVENKPVPGSADGTSRGQPCRFLAADQGMNEESGNVGVSPAAIAVWQLGYPGLVLLIVANVLQLYVINSLLLTRSLLLHCLAFYFIGLPSLVTLFASPDVVLVNLQRVAVMFVLVVGAGALRR
jgi:hypothetical protein